MSLRKKILIAVGVLFFLFIVGVLLARSTGVVNIGSSDLKSYSNSDFSILYPNDYSASSSGNETIMTPSDNETGAEESLTITKYLSSSDATVTTANLKELATKNLNGNIIAEAEEFEVNGNPALHVIPMDESSGGLTEKMFIIGKTDTWLIVANYGKDKTVLSKNISDIFQSFKTSGGSE